VQPEADAVNASAEIKVRAERRMGEELAKAELGQGRRTDLVVRDDQVAKPTLAEIGISKDQSSRYQHLAAIAEWVRLTDGNKGASCADIPRGRGQPQGGINAAVRDLGIDRSET
jgi:hypothetical protein